MAGITGKRGVSWLARLSRRIATWLGRSAPDGRDGVWHRGEDYAAAYLANLGYVILERNAVTPRGEADMLARDPDGRTLVIVEVKARTVGRNARSDTRPPEAAFTRAKRRRLRAIASHLARSNAGSAVRVDLVAVELHDSAPPTIRHYPRAA
ncbi:MAG: hypothetical protein HBSAPP03_20870 [Phycisphaerae bacterium]|nr:MAG: hypothetical protein HBSAPP03_20870 [Phycisphaerae bacterium]